MFDMIHRIRILISFVFASLLLIGIVIQTDIFSKNGALAGTISQNWDFNTRFLEQTFWDDNPYIGNWEVKKIFSVNTVYTKNRSSSCNPASITEVAIDPNLSQTIPQTLNANTLYVLRPWVHIITGTIDVSGSCVGLIGGWSWTMIIPDSSSVTKFLQVDWGASQARTGIIIDGIVFNGSWFTNFSEWFFINWDDWASDITINNITLTWVIKVWCNTYFWITDLLVNGIALSFNSIVKNSTISNSTIANSCQWATYRFGNAGTNNQMQNVKILNSQRYGIQVYDVPNWSITLSWIIGHENNSWSVQFELSSGNKLINSTISKWWIGVMITSDSTGNLINWLHVYNTDFWWIFIVWKQNIINNVIAYNNNLSNNILGWNIVLFLWSAQYNALNNIQSFNSNAGIALLGGFWNPQYNLISNAHIYNNTYGINLSSADNNSIANSSIYNNNVWVNISSSAGNQYLGNFLLFDNSTNISGWPLTAWWSYLVGQASNQIIGTGKMNCHWATTPVNNLGSTFFNFSTLYNSVPGCNTRGVNGSRTATTGTSYIIFPRISKQSQPMRYAGTTVVNSSLPGLSYNSAMYVGEQGDFGGSVDIQTQAWDTLNGDFINSASVDHNILLSSTQTAVFTLTGDISSTQTWLISSNTLRPLPLTTQNGIRLVKAINNAYSFSRLSNIYWQFIILSDTVSPTIPTPLSPLSWTTTSNPFTLSRAASNDTGFGLSGYTLTIYSDSSCSSQLQNITLGSSSTSILLSGFSNGTYCWKIKAFDKLLPVANTSAYSTGNIFTINGTLDQTAPFITISPNPDSTTAGSKTVGGTMNEAGTLSYQLLTTGAQCTGSAGFTGSTTAWSITLNFTSPSDNGKFVCFRAQDSAGNVSRSWSNLVTGIVDITPPTISISGPSAGSSTSKTVSATINEPGTMFAYTTSNQSCDAGISSSLFSSYTSGSTLTFSTSSDNGKYVCFKAIDTIGNISFQLSQQINNIVVNDTTPPVITITNPNTLQESLKVVSASMDDPGTLAYVVVSAGSQCDGSIGWFTSGATVLMSSSSQNGLKVCFRATNTSNLVSYAASNIIQGLQGSSTITINQPNTLSEPTKTISASSTVGSLYQVVTNSSVCDNTLYGFASYAPITFSSIGDNGKRVCYRATDGYGNDTYKLSDPIQGISSTGFYSWNPQNADVCYGGDYSPSPYDGICTANPNNSVVKQCNGKIINFVDINNAQYANEILRMVDHCFINGYPPYTHFGPNQTPTIGEFYAVLIRIIENGKNFNPADYKNKKYFVDNKSRYRYAGYLNRAYEYGFTQGIEKFGRTSLRYINPRNTMTLQDAVGVLNLVLQKMGVPQATIQQKIDNAVSSRGGTFDRSKMAKLFFDLFGIQ